LVADEIATISFMLNKEPVEDPEVGVKSQNSVGSTGTFIKTASAPKKSTTESVFEWLIPFLAAVQIPLVIYGLNRVRRRLKTPSMYQQCINNAAFAYIHCGLHEEAKEMLAQEIKTRGADTFVLSNYALCLALDRNFEEASKTLAAAELMSISDHEKAVLFLNQALAFLLQEELSEGLKALDKAFEASREEIAKYCSHSVVVGDLKEKIREFEVALDERLQ
jgi:tetratricopeptide (TPR) repeat protein